MMTVAPSDGNPWDNLPGGPDPANITSTEARSHIVWGDGETGGHSYRAGMPDKTVFPESWGDDKIMKEVQSVARNPDETPVWQDDHGTYLVTGTRDGVTMDVAVDEDGNVVTAYPTAGPGVCVTDDEGDPHPLADQDASDWAEADQQAQDESEDQAAAIAQTEITAEEQAMAAAQLQEAEAEALAIAEAEGMVDDE